MRIALVLALPVCAAAPALAVTDDFADNDNTPRWLIVEDNPTALSIAEAHGRVEMTAHGTAALSNDALFLSDRSQGFALSTAGDFAFTADLTLAGFTSSVGQVAQFTFGLGRDAAGTDSAAIVWTLADAGPGFLSQVDVVVRTDGSDSVTTIGAGPSVAALPTTQTFTAGYDQSLDRLTFAMPDAGLSHNIDNVLASPQWNASSVLYSFGIRGATFTLASGDAYWDDFDITAGTEVPSRARWRWWGHSARVRSAGVKATRRYLQPGRHECLPPPA